MTLHVGAGTFLPVKSADTEPASHACRVGRIVTETAQRLNETRRGGGRIVAVGTTSLRLLESAAGEDGTIRPFDGETDHLHHAGLSLPRRRRADDQFPPAALDLFMLVAAFSGLDTMKRAYAHAIAAGYRFYSYGDACLLFPSPMTATTDFSFRLLGHRRWRRRRGAIDTPRGRANAGLHAGRHRRTVKACRRTRCARPAPTSSSATPIT